MDLIELGYASKPHGIKGEISLVLHSGDESILAKGMQVYLFPSGSASKLSASGELFTIKTLRFGNKVVISFKEIVDRNHVEEILPFTLKLSRESFPEPDDDEFYLSDIIGWDVINDATDEFIGTLTKFYENGAQEVFCIEKKTGEMIEIPYVDHFVPSIDFDKKEVRINPPEYIDGE